MNVPRIRQEQPQIGWAILLFGAMSLGLAAGLDILNLVSRFDASLTRVFAPPSLATPSLALSRSVVWLASAFLAFALPAVLLHVPGMCRRGIIFLLTICLTLSWGPVLVLAARRPEISIALIAVLWSGLCAIYYAHNHRLPVDNCGLNLVKKKNGTS